jgi:hypothetical protein
MHDTRIKPACRSRECQIMDPIIAKGRRVVERA